MVKSTQFQTIPHPPNQPFPRPWVGLPPRPPQAPQVDPLALAQAVAQAVASSFAQAMGQGVTQGVAQGMQLGIRPPGPWPPGTSAPRHLSPPAPSPQVPSPRHLSPPAPGPQAPSHRHLSPQALSQVLQLQPTAVRVRTVTMRMMTLWLISRRRCRSVEQLCMQEGPCIMQLLQALRFD